MSGPVSAQDVAPVRDRTEAAAPCVEITDSRDTEVGDMRVRRALPRRARRTVGAWCFVDHMGPGTVSGERGIGIGPHPHIGLQTVTWLLAGEILHRDSLGSEQVIRPGQLNLMTAGHGVAHSEEGSGSYRGDLHGVQLWVVQPSATRHGAAAFEHHADLPMVELLNGVATVLVGELANSRSPARRDTDHVGIDLDLRAATVDIPLRLDYEHAIVVFTGAITIDGSVVRPGRLAYLGEGRGECALVALEPSRALLVGGRPFEEPIMMWWNFVAADRDEIVDAYQAWAAGEGRFGRVGSPLSPIAVGPPPWISGG